MSHKWVALSFLTPHRTRQQQKRMRHKDDIHDEDVENQQPSSQDQMTPIILQQGFLHTFKPVSHIGAMNNTWFTECVHDLKPTLYLIKFFTIILPYIVPKSKLYLYKFFTFIFPYIVQKPEQSRASHIVLSSRKCFLPLDVF